MSLNFHGAPLKMELDGKIMTLDLQLHMHALRVTLRSLARHSPNGSPEWQLREWNSLKDDSNDDDDENNGNGGIGGSAALAVGAQ
jgi:hypothetical protein